MSYYTSWIIPHLRKPLAAVAGGASVTVTVEDSTGLTGVSFNGVNATGFAIVDATHVSCSTSESGSVSVVTYNSVYRSPPLLTTI